MATYQRLYEERKIDTESDRYYPGEDPRHAVDLLLEKWDNENGRKIYVMTYRVFIDYNLEVDHKSILDEYYDNKAIRYAIETFDRVVEAHPYF